MVNVAFNKIHQIDYEWLKGKMESYVTATSEPLNKVAKTIQTSLKQGKVDSSELKRMFSEAEKESVEAFIRHHSYVDRKKRLEDLKKILCLYTAS